MPAAVTCSPNVRLLACLLIAGVEIFTCVLILADSLQKQILMTPTADQSACILTAALRAREPFTFMKWGDGAIEVMHQIARFDASCDGEPSRQDDASALLMRECWQAAKEASLRTKVYLGDWFTASDFGPNDVQMHEPEYRAMCHGTAFEYLHYECLLLMRLSPALLDFYRALREDPRKKVLVTASVGAAAQMLGAEHIPSQPPREYGEHWGDYYGKQAAERIQASGAEIVLFAAGGVGQFAQGYLFDAGLDHLTTIHIGSGIDPLFLGRTRGVQIPRDQARAYFRELL